jgi:hypothetical protein
VGKIAARTVPRGQRRTSDFAHAEMPRQAPLPTLQRTTEPHPSIASIIWIENPHF